jgi:hypothetical protein
MKGQKKFVCYDNNPSELAKKDVLLKFSLQDVTGVDDKFGSIIKNIIKDIKLLYNLK